MYNESTGDNNFSSKCVEIKENLNSSEPTDSSSFDINRKEYEGSEEENSNNEKEEKTGENKFELIGEIDVDNSGFCQYENAEEVYDPNCDVKFGTIIGASNPCEDTIETIVSQLEGGASDVSDCLIEDTIQSFQIDESCQVNNENSEKEGENITLSSQSVENSSCDNNNWVNIQLQEQTSGDDALKGNKETRDITSTCEIDISNKIANVQNGCPQIESNASNVNENYIENGESNAEDNQLDKIDAKNSFKTIGEGDMEAEQEKALVKDDQDFSDMPQLVDSTPYSNKDNLAKENRNSNSVEIFELIAENIDQNKTEDSMRIVNGSSMEFDKDHVSCSQRVTESLSQNVSYIAMDEQEGKNDNVLSTRISYLSNRESLSDNSQSDSKTCKDVQNVTEESDSLKEERRRLEVKQKVLAYFDTLVKEEKLSVNGAEAEGVISAQDNMNGNIDERKASSLETSNDMPSANSMSDKEAGVDIKTTTVPTDLNIENQTNPSEEEANEIEGRHEASKEPVSGNSTLKRRSRNNTMKRKKKRKSKLYF